MRGDAPPLTAAQQLYHLRRSDICHGEGTVLGGRLMWRFEAQPTALSRSYGVRIELRPGVSPKVIVEHPDLEILAGGRKLPHVYGQVPVELCLYMPGTGEWVPNLRLDQSLVPWAYLWLFFFEEWLLSNDWKGGGQHPERGVPRRRDPTAARWPLRRTGAGRS